MEPVRTVVFVAPFAMPTTMRFASALAALQNIRLIGVFQKAPVDSGEFAGIVVIDDVFDLGLLVGAINRATGNRPPHRILGILEQLQMTLARARAHFGVPGPDVETSARFRDKGLMKDEIRRHGLPCAAYRRVASPQQAHAFVDEIGWPVILKPPAGAGSKGTFRANDKAALDHALERLQPSPERPVLVEEFLSGSEFSFETITLGGVVQFHSIGRYYPGPLEVMENRHLQWVCVLPRDISGDEFAAVREMGPKAVRDLGLDTGMTHMEWFKRPNGTIAIGEIALRPPGAQIVKLMSLAYDIDMYKVWARAVVDDAFDGPWERKYSVGVAFLRGTGSGKITRTEGLKEAQIAMGDLVVEAKLPAVGAMRSDHYEGDGHVIVRHQDTDKVEGALLALIQTVSVRYERP